MAVTYPATLPQNPQRGGYNREQVSNVISSKVDVGEAKKRRRFAIPIFNESWSMILTATQIPIFTSWFEDDLKSGVLRFEYTDIITDTLQEFRIQEMYKLVPYGSCGGYMVTFNVERLP